MIRLVLCLLLAHPAAAADLLLLSYFRGNGETGVYLAASPDGHQFTALNDDQPVFIPPRWPDQSLTRDPSIVFHDGTFHMVWTSNWKGRVFGYASSPDLKQWSEPLMVRPFPASLPEEDQPVNVWAPEIHRDPVHDDFFILFSSTTPRELKDGDSIVAHNLDHRSYITRTKDGKNFSDARLFFDPGFSVIDPVMQLHGDRWAMVFKHELQPGNGGKNLRLTFVPKDFESPFPPKIEPPFTPILGPGSEIRPNEQVEGPSLLRHNGRWWLYCDAFRNHHYTLITSPDLQTWSDETDQLEMPEDLRHGTVFLAPEARVAWADEP